MAHPDTSPDATAPEKIGGTTTEADEAAIDLGGEADRSFDPSEVEANRTREQGNGVGERELSRQRDPTRGDDSEHFGQMSAEDGGRSDVERGGGGKGGVEGV